MDEERLSSTNTFDNNSARCIWVRLHLASVKHTGLERTEDPILDLLQVSLAEKTGEGKKRERLVILGTLINIHELSSQVSILKNDGVIFKCFIEA